MREVITSPSRRDRRSTSARTSSAGCGSRVAAGRPARSSRCATPRCSRTASSAPGRCARADGDRPLHPAGRRRRDLGAARSPSTASATPRSTGWPGELDPADDRRRRGAHRHGAHRLVRMLRPAAQPAARERRLGHARQLPRPAHRLPAARRAARLDRRHPGLRARPRRFLYDCDGFLASWLRDLAARAGGATAACRSSCPTSLGSAADAGGRVGRRRDHRAVGAATSASATSACSRRSIDEHARPGSTRSLGLAGERRLWEGGFQFGDWLDPDAPPDRPGRRARPTPTSSPRAYLARSADLVAEAAARARATTSDADALRRARRARSARPSAARVRHARRAGSCRDAQTAYALAIVFDLVDRRRARRRDGRPARRAGPARRLPHRHRLRRHAARLRRARPHRATSTSPYRLLLQTECPSWLYPVTMGATTIWERWDSMLADGTINPGEMTSFNHYALGAVADWLHRRVAGLAPAEPGYRRLTVAPRPAARARPRGDGARDAVRACPRRLVRGRGTDHRVGDGPAEHACRGPPPGSLGDIRGGFGAAPLDARRQQGRPPHRRAGSAQLAGCDRRGPRGLRDGGRSARRGRPEWSRTFRRHTQWVEERRLSEAFLLGAPNLESRVESALDELNGRRRR